MSTKQTYCPTCYAQNGHAVLQQYFEISQEKRPSKLGNAMAWIEMAVEGPPGVAAVPVLCELHSKPFKVRTPSMVVR